MQVDEKRRFIPHEYVIQFKTLFRGLEVHRVLGDRVLVDEVEPFTEQDAVNERLAKDGTGKAIIAPQQFYDANGIRRLTEKPKACVGIVISMGKGVADTDIAEGAAVCFGAYAGTEYFIGGAKFRILDTKEILAVLRATAGNALTDVIAPVKAG
jgi:co-chaperonin GroES (HSP10)